MATAWQVSLSIWLMTVMRKRGPGTLSRLSQKYCLGVAASTVLSSGPFGTEECQSSWSWNVCCFYCYRLIDKSHIDMIVLSSRMDSLTISDDNEGALSQSVDAVEEISNKEQRKCM
uniref:Uncharacterized protein n=1 Tax=Setaria digitata TaxID=48799 RepID=A0A915PG15_9BILA